MPPTRCLVLFAVVFSAAPQLLAQGFTVVRADCVGLINGPVIYGMVNTPVMGDGPWSMGLAIKNTVAPWGVNPPPPPTIDCSSGIKPGHDVGSGRTLQWGKGVVESVYTTAEVDHMIKELRNSDAAIISDLTKTMRNEVYTQLLKNVQEEAWRAEIVQAVKADFQQQIDALKTEIAQLRNERAKGSK